MSQIYYYHDEYLSAVSYLTKVHKLIEQRAEDIILQCIERLIEKVDYIRKSGRNSDFEICGECEWDIGITLINEQHRSVRPENREYYTNLVRFIVPQVHNMQKIDFQKGDGLVPVIVEKRLIQRFTKEK